MGRMGTTKAAGLLRAAAMTLSVLVVASCDSPDVVCGGSIDPSGATPYQLKLVDVAKLEAAGHCGVGGQECDYSVYKTKAGQTVRATRVSAQGGECVSYFGGDKYFAFDDKGVLVEVIDGLWQRSSFA